MKRLKILKNNPHNKWQMELAKLYSMSKSIYKQEI